MELLFKKIYSIQIILLLCVFCGFSQSSTGSVVKTLVIDAGHGGTMPGAVGKESKEKDIALAVALKFGALVKQNFSDVRVIYTRTDDKSVELRERSIIANRNKADLFISIHCNSSKNTAARGVETWVMGLHESDRNLNVARTENADILKEQNYEKNYDGFNPNSPDAYIIFSMYQNAYLDQSINFAQKIQKQYQSLVASPNRGIFQAGFVVLWGCTMPSVLTEIGFISNLEEERFLNSKDGQDKIATSLLNAFREYKYQIEGFGNQAASTQPAAATQSNAVKTTNTPSQQDTKQTTKVTPPTGTAAQSGSKAEKEPNPETVVFKVQFASSSIDKPLNSPEFSVLQNISKYQENSVYKYCSGEETELARAKDLLQVIQAKGFRDAFVVAFKGGKRISMSEALKK